MKFEKGKSPAYATDYDRRLRAPCVGGLATLQGLLSAKKFAALLVVEEALIGKEGRFCV